MNENELKEKAQKLSQKAGVSVEEAEEALKQTGYDMLDAYVYLQRRQNNNAQGGPEVFSTEYGNAEYSGNQYQYQNQRYQQNYQQYQQYQNTKSTSFGEAVGKAVKWVGDMIKKGMDNYFTIERNQMTPMRIPITVAVLLLCLLNGFALILLIVGLFFGFRYSFEGPNIRNQADDVNDMLHNAGKKAQEFTNDVKEEFKKN